MLTGLNPASAADGGERLGGQMDDLSHDIPVVRTAEVVDDAVGTAKWFQNSGHLKQ